MIFDPEEFQRKSKEIFENKVKPQIEKSKMSKEKPTTQELLEQVMSLSDKIEFEINDLKKEVSKLSDEEKTKLLEGESFGDLKDSLKGLVGELEKLNKNK